MSLLAQALELAEDLAEDLAPEWALRRQTARARSQMIRASGYSHHGASRTKKSLAGWLSWGGGPDRDIVDNLDLLRERSRDLFMGEGLAAGALRTIRTNEIGAGLQLNAQIDSKFLGLTDEQATEWEDVVEREFSLWARSRNCDAQRRCTFGELQGLARLSQMMSGDVFALLPAVPRPGDRYDLKVKLLEADRCSSPEIVAPGVPPSQWPDVFGGVEVDADGAPVAFYFEDRHPGDVGVGPIRLVSQRKWTRIPAYGDKTGRPLVLHLMDIERPGQRRGVPILAPVIEKLKQLSRYSDAELMAAVVSGMFTAAITSSAPETPLGQVLPSDPTKPGAQIPTGDSNDYQLGPGALLGLAPGEKLEAINPARPNAGFEPFVLAVCRQVGAGLGLPYELVVMQFTASYSASRGALLEAWKRFQVGRQWIVAGFCQPIYEQWLEEAVARGYVKAPGFLTDPVVRAAWCGAEWIGPTQGQLDPTKEVEAAAKRVAEGFSTRTKETRELTGGDFWAFHRLRVREEQARSELPQPEPTTPGDGNSAPPAPQEAP